MSEVNQLLCAILDRCGEVHEGSCPKAWVTLARKLEAERDASVDEMSDWMRIAQRRADENAALTGLLQEALVKFDARLEGGYKAPINLMLRIQAAIDAALGGGA